MEPHQNLSITIPNSLFPSPQSSETWTFWDPFIRDNQLTTFTIKEDQSLEFSLFEESPIFNENPKGNLPKIQRRIKTILSTSSFPQDMVKTAKKAYKSNPQYMHLAIDRTDWSDMKILNVLDEEFESIRDLEDNKMLNKVEDEELNWWIFGTCKEINFINAHEQELEEDDYYQKLPPKKSKRAKRNREKSMRIKKAKQESDIKVRTEPTYWERDPARKRGYVAMADEETDVDEENEEISESSEEELDLIVVIEAREEDELLEKEEQENLLKKDEDEVVEVVLIELEEDQSEQEAIISIELEDHESEEQEGVVILVELEEDEFEDKFKGYKESSEARKRLKNREKKKFNRRERERILNGEMGYGLVNGKRRRMNSSQKRKMKENLMPQSC